MRGHGDRVDLVVLSYERMWELGNDARFDGCTRPCPGSRRSSSCGARTSCSARGTTSSTSPTRSPSPTWSRSRPACSSYDPAFDYRRLLERWCAVLGREAVVPIVYQKNESSVEAFFRQAGVEIELERRMNTPYVNQAVDGFGLAVLREVKRLARDDGGAAPPGGCGAGPAGPALPCLPSTGHSATASPSPSVAGSWSPTEAPTEWVARHFFPDRDELFPPLEPGERVGPGPLGGPAARRVHRRPTHAERSWRARG